MLPCLFPAAILRYVYPSAVSGKFEKSSRQVISYHCFYQHLISQYNLFYTNLLFLIKIKAEHIALFQMEMIQISGQLLFSPLIICISMPYF